MNRFLTWLREWRGLQARLWVAHEDVHKMRQRVLFLEGVELELRNDNVNLRIEADKMRERLKTFAWIIHTVRRAFNTAKPISAAEVRAIQDEITEKLRPRRGETYRW